MSATRYDELSAADLSATVDLLESEFAVHRRNNQQLDLTRGKPAPDQLDLSNALDGCLGGNYIDRDGVDTRNYGGLFGIGEARELGGELLGVEPDHVLAGGNSSLALMHAATEFAIHQRWHDTRPTMLCPVPGYDRHFTLCNSLGLAMRNVAIGDAGPDMDAIEQAVETDAGTGGIWCVPRFSNPTGCVYSDETVARIAALPRRAAHPSFFVFWDNAYSVHALVPGAPPLANLMDAAREHGTGDHMFMFASTSKITFAGAGIAFFAGSATTLDAFTRALTPVTIGPDKVNQLRTARFLGGRLTEHMAAHAALLQPKFELVEEILARELGGLGIAHWTRPEGGYFVSLDTLPGLAREIVAMTGSAGVKLTAAGATFPHGDDPKDSNIRIAPTYPDTAELGTALTVLTAAIKLASARKLGLRGTRNGPGNPSKKETV